MKKIFYEKRGNRYYPVSEYNSELMESNPKGAHLLVCVPGGISKKYNINPEYASLIAAAYVARERMLDLIVRESETRPTRAPITPEQRAAWEQMKLAYGDELVTIQTNSAYNILQAGIDALVEEQELLLKNPAVKRAYDHFITVARLTADDKNNA